MLLNRVVCCVAVALVFMVSSARAELIVADDFSYSDGALAGKNGGAAGSGSSWSGAYSGDVGWNVSGGQITASGSDGVGRSFSTDFSGSPAAPLYFSARFRVPSDSDGFHVYVAQYIYDTSSGNGFNFGLYWGKDDPAQLPRVLQPFVMNTPTGNPGIFSTAGSYTAGTEALIVGKVEFNVDGNKERIQIWVDPTNVETSTQSAQIAIDIEWTTPNLIYVEVGHATVPLFMDDVRVGDTWADVGPVPEPSTLLLLATGLIGLLCYAWRKRR